VPRAGAEGVKSLTAVGDRLPDGGGGKSLPGAAENTLRPQKKHYPTLLTPAQESAVQIWYSEFLERLFGATKIQKM
jgi:hypothetical protein